MHEKRWKLLLLIPFLMAALVWALHTDDVRNARLRIGATYMTMNNPFYSVIDEELRLMIESRGDIPAYAGPGPQPGTAERTDTEPAS